jgi:DNA-binding LacI/PurR family transcriptional regulator
MATVRPTMEDVAARAGVSRALVSIVFRNVPGASESTRARVLAAAADLSYQPDRRASRLGRSRTRMVGVVFGFEGDFHAEVIDGIYTAADRRGYEVVLSAATTRRSEATAVAAVLAEGCEAVILIGPQLASRDIADLAQRVPTIVLLRHLRLNTVDIVRSNERRGTTLLVDHLVTLGHRDIFHLKGGRAAGAAQRRTAYAAAMHTHGLTPRFMPGGLDERAGAHGVDQILARSRDQWPTAISAFNDRSALGVLHRLRSTGLAVPNDMSVTGYDDIRAAAYPHLSLTTIRQDADALGREAMQRVYQRLEHNEPPGTPLLIPPKLMRRGTTGPAPGDGVDPVWWTSVMRLGGPLW